MEKLFESVYRECHFSELKTFKAGKELVTAWKDAYNDTWRRGTLFIKDINYCNGDKTVTITFNKPVSLELIKDNLIDDFPINQFSPFTKSPSVFKTTDEPNVIIAFLSESK